MARLPDRFDLWVRKAKECRDAARQADYILGALAGLKDWYFAAVSREDVPVPGEIEGANYVMVFSDHSRLDEIPLAPGSYPLRTISMPTATAMAWCVERKTGLMLNPAEQGTVLIPFDQLEAFHSEWKKRGGRQAAGFWIPHMTSEEEDFWQEHGL
jgi:hypothetical protein